MQRRRLGLTGLEVSCLTVGTVEQGMDYGIPVPGDFGRPEQADAVALLRMAADSRVNLFDTAPTYGKSEELLGLALSGRQDCYFATKVRVPESDSKPLTGPPLQRAVAESLRQSLRSLRRDVLDIVLIHNATVEMIEQSDTTALLQVAQARGDVRHLGASVYDEEAALAAVRSGGFDVIQVAYNLLDQRMAERVFREARGCGVGVLARSPLLKGALSAKSQWLPAELHPLRDAVARVRMEMGVSWDELPGAALRFSLSNPNVDSVVFGPRTTAELQVALDAVRRGPLEQTQLAVAAGLALHGAPMLNPSTWALP
ncbi:MAG: aldo/keto reductase [Planctomycetes bacterium]|nr:aldo/keto reductase [Planctomycetota bacterium]